MTAGEDEGREDRRVLHSIADRLARMEGGQDAHRAAVNGRLDRIESKQDSNHSEAEHSRRALHETVMDMRGKMRVFEQEIEYLTQQMTLMAPMAAVNALTEAHRAVETVVNATKVSVQELKEAKIKVEGVTEGVGHAARGIGAIAKGMWAVLITVGGVVGGAVVAAVEHFMMGGGTPPGK